MMTAKSATPKLALLLAEDNPHISDMLQRALTPLANITIVPDGADALLRATERQPDLVVADFTLPGLDGLRLLEKLRSRAPTRDLGYVLMAPRGDLEHISQQARQLADEIVEKPFLIDDAVAAVQRVISRLELQRAIRSTSTGSQPSDDSRMRGRLSQLSLVDLLQALELGGKSCCLTVKRLAEQCEIIVDQGVVVHAKCGGLAGDEAVFAALAWPDGSFELDFSRKISATRNVQRSTQALLMDGLRLLDESRHAAAEAGNILEE